MGGEKTWLYYYKHHTVIQTQNCKALVILIIDIGRVNDKMIWVMLGSPKIKTARISTKDNLFTIQAL